MLTLNCNFENISKGRCILKVNPKKKKKTDTLFVFTDKALMLLKFDMIVEIEKIVQLLSCQESQKKTSIILQF